MPLLRPRLVTALLTSVLASLLALVTALLLLTSAPAQAAPAGDHPGPGDDFPVMPSHCQSPYQQLPFRACHVTSYGRGRPMVVVWGDSHAWMYQPAYVKDAKKRRVNLVEIFAGGCPPALSRPRVEGHDYTECETRQPQALAWIEKQASSHASFKLLVGGYWAYYRRGWIETHDPAHPHADRYSHYAGRLINLAHHGVGPMFSSLAAHHVDTDVIGPSGTVPYDPPPCDAGTDPYQCDLRRAQSLYQEHRTRTWILRRMAPLPGHPRLIDTSPSYCTSTTCHAHVDGVNTWFDGLHLGATFTRTLSSYFLPTFDDVAGVRG